MMRLGGLDSFGLKRNKGQSRGQYPVGEKQDQPFQLSFNASLKVEKQNIKPRPEESDRQRRSRCEDEERAHASGAQCRVTVDMDSGALVAVTL